MASTSTTPQITSTLNTTDWHVFLSFRGEDTRYGFTAHLHNALTRQGIRTFMDDPDLRSGEIISDALMEAIRNSKTYIVVLSQNYASSSWCLDELVEILRCFKESKRVVIPVFYNIQPSVVRYQTGSFETAFRNHETRFAREIEKVNNWRHTLKEIADLSGKHVDETRSEVDIRDEIVQTVLTEINLTIHVANYPIGIDSRVAELTPLLTREIENVVSYIGIWGMGGVGKTTLAKAVFNANFSSFEGSCFLANVAEVFSQPKGPEGLQAQLIADVLKVEKPQIDSIDKGKELIKQRISSKKILIVLDDLNDKHQLDSLVVGSFAPGSVIILTTRKEDLLVTVGVEATYRYMVQELDDADSRRLFNKHAFPDENPSDKFLVLSEEILHHAGGLPLALELFGSNLRNQPEAQWRRFIGELKEVVNPTIKNNLVISFKSLVSPALKEMFLDIACFFVGRLRKEFVPILESCYKDVDANIDHLKSRCLIKIDGNNEFSMHDLVRDMGREFARNSRISGDDIYNVLDDINNDNKGTEEIECMVDHYGYVDDGVSFDTDTIKRVPKLRFLKMTRVNLTGSFEQIFKNLRWLHWAECPLETLPSDFCPKNLVILELQYSTITRWNLTKDLRNLKILDLSYSEELITTPDFRRLPCLEKIDLNGCFNLEKVDKTIGDLKNLASLDLTDCVSLCRLPDSVCKLTALETLDIGRSLETPDTEHSLEALPDELGNMKSLTRLAVDSTQISKLPDSIGRLTKLVDIGRLLNWVWKS